MKSKITQKLAGNNVLIFPLKSLLFFLIFFSSSYFNSFATVDPTIEFTHVPAFGCSANCYISGKVHNCPNPTSHKIAMYIHVEGNGWWTKPTFANPLTTINSDSTFSCNIVTGGCDKYATKICAFLLPNGVTPPACGQCECLPDSLGIISIARQCTTRYGKQLNFGGLEWWAKTSCGPVGPNSCNFSDSNAYVDTQGRLHLKLEKRYGKWYCAEVVSKQSFGYGKYCFQVSYPLYNLDRNVVLGLFTWDYPCFQGHKEIDIEFSRWGIQSDPNAQYVVQPYTLPNHRYRWNMPSGVTNSTHIFHWEPDTVKFLSVNGLNCSPPYDTIHYWQCTDSIPTDSTENVRMNLWLNDTTGPSNGQNVEVIINFFKFEPTVSVKKISTIIPEKFHLYQNYPNPFNPFTNIRFDISRPSHVKLIVYDILGKEVTTLANEKLNAGIYEVNWPATTEDASGYPSGVYFYRMVIHSDKLQTGDFVDTKRMVYLK